MNGHDAPEDQPPAEAGGPAVTGLWYQEPDVCPPGTCQSPTERRCAFFGCAKPTIYRAWVAALERNSGSTAPRSTDM